MNERKERTVKVANVSESTSRGFARAECDGFVARLLEDPEGDVLVSVYRGRVNVLGLFEATPFGEGYLSAARATTLVLELEQQLQEAAFYESWDGWCESLDSFRAALAAVVEPFAAASGFNSKAGS
jgi:hypothetical protein